VLEGHRVIWGRFPVLLKKASAVRCVWRQQRTLQKEQVDLVSFWEAMWFLGELVFGFLPRRIRCTCCPMQSGRGDPFIGYRAGPLCPCFRPSRFLPSPPLAASIPVRSRSSALAATALREISTSPFSTAASVVSCPLHKLIAARSRSRRPSQSCFWYVVMARLPCSARGRRAAQTFRKFPAIVSFPQAVYAPLAWEV